jgi:hypothetical protein
MRTVRRLFWLLAFGMPGLVSAQDLESARVMMDGALTELGTHNRLTLILNGTENDGGKVHSFSAVLKVGFSLVTSRQVVQMELLDFRDNQLRKRVAGDGERFWDYDLMGKVYTSTEYGTARYAGKERERLFQNMLLRLKGEQTFLARLIKDTYGGTLNASTAWVPWRPSSSVSVQGENIVCTSTAPSPNRLTYSLQQTPGFGYTLMGVDYFEEALVGNKLRTTQWTVSIMRDHIPDGTSWVFVPPVGSRAVSVSEGG